MIDMSIAKYRRVGRLSMNKPSGRKPEEQEALSARAKIADIPYVRVYNELRKRSGSRLLLSGTSVIVIILHNLLNQFIGHGHYSRVT